MFDLEKARKEEYSNQQIIDYLTTSRKFDTEGARKEGWSDEAIIAHLQTLPIVVGGGERGWLSKVGEFAKGVAKPVGEVVAPQLPMIGATLGGVAAVPAAVATAPTGVGPIAAEAAGVGLGYMAGAELERRMKEWLGIKEPPKTTGEAFKETAQAVPAAAESALLGPAVGAAAKPIAEKVAPALYRAGMRFAAPTSPAAKATQERAVKAGMETYGLQFPGQPTAIVPATQPFSAVPPQITTTLKSLEKGAIPISKGGREVVAGLKRDLGEAIDSFIATDPNKVIDLRNFGKYFDNLIDKAKFSTAPKAELTRLLKSIQKTFEPYANRPLTTADAQAIKKELYTRLSDRDFQQTATTFAKDYTKTVANAMKTELENAFATVPAGFKIREAGKWRDATLKDLNMKYGDLKVLDNYIFKALEKKASGVAFMRDVVIDSMGAALGYAHSGGMGGVLGGAGTAMATQILKKPEVLSRLSFAIERAAGRSPLARAGRNSGAVAARDLVEQIAKGQEQPTGEEEK